MSWARRRWGEEGSPKGIKGRGRISTFNLPLNAGEVSCRSFVWRPREFLSPPLPSLDAARPSKLASSITAEWCYAPKGGQRFQRQNRSKFPIGCLHYRSPFLGRPPASWQTANRGWPLSPLPSVFSLDRERSWLPFETNSSIRWRKSWGRTKGESWTSLTVREAFFLLFESMIFFVFIYTGSWYIILRIILACLPRLMEEGYEREWDKESSRVRCIRFWARDNDSRVEWMGRNTRSLAYVIAGRKVIS